MRRLLYIGSPQFDGIGMLNTEAQKLQRNGHLTIVDGIFPNAYPEIKNFDRADYCVWKLIRKKQFLGVLNASALDYIEIADLVKGLSAPASEQVRQVLEDSIRDHCVCNNIVGEYIEQYRKSHWDKHYEFLCRASVALKKLLQEGRFSEIVVFNGRNTMATLLVALARDVGIPICWLEYFGKRSGRMTYIASPVDIFDFDAMSEYIFEAYSNEDDPAKEDSARECLRDRVKTGDPLLKKWGVNFSTSPQSEMAREKKIAAFFFSSEDEYPAVKPSIYGFNPPNEQYYAFARICERILAEGLQKDFHFLVKLHPRYAAEKNKLNHAQNLWNEVLEHARKQGLDFELVEPLTSAYKVIEDSDVIFSYGSTAWEATYLGKPAVLMGPNFFATHDCAYIANGVEDVISYLKEIPSPKAVENCYPYAWAWRELGHQCAHESLFST
jgi:hypothetical protein